MMKRAFSCILCAFVLLSSLTLSAFANSKPDGTGKVPELIPVTTLPDMSTVISTGLNSSNAVSVKTLLDDWPKVPAFSAKDKADIGNYRKYGISAVGFANFGRPLCSISDGVWGVGNAGMATASGKCVKGAFDYIMDEFYYNLEGEAAPEGKGAEDGYIYQAVLTYNFGKIADLSAFAYTLTGTSANSFFQAADIYVSDNGESWTQVAYYDRPTARMENKDYADRRITADQLGPDALNKSFDTPDAGSVYCFKFPAGTSGQFLRFGVTSQCGTSRPVDSTNYDNYSQPMAQQQNFRELLIFGTLTDRVGYTYEEDPNETENDETEEVTTGIKIVVKPKKEPVTTSAVEAETDSAEKKADPAGGCKSAVGGGMFAVMALCGAAFCVKKRGTRVSRKTEK